MPSSELKDRPAVSDATAETTAAAVVPPAEIQGLVDNASATRIYGWAWNVARPAERLAIELRLRKEIVAATIADRPRADLAKANIGDGSHAFEVPLRPEWAASHAELSVVARAADGSEAPLALRVRRADIDPSGALQRVLEATASAHRQLRKEIQSVAAQLPNDETARTEAIRTLAASQVALTDKLETLTIWLTRLDERLAVLPVPAPAAAPRRRADPWQVVLSATLAAVLVLAALGTGALFLAR